MDTATFPLTTARSILLLSLHILDLRTIQRYDMFAVPVVDSDGVLVGKELGVALVLGASMAAGVALIASFRAPEIIAVVSLTMMLVVLVGSIVGMSLPFLLSKFNLDPATASAPLITSIADICGVLIYFSIATWYLGIG